MVVSGAIRNVETHPREAAALRVSLLDKHGHSLKDMVLPPTAGHIEPGQARAFKATFIDPPPAGVNVQVEFVLDHPAGHGKPDAHPAKAHTPKAPAGEHGPAHAPVQPAHGDHAPAATAPAHPEPVVARSLPAESPYALPPAAVPGHAVPAHAAPAHAEEAGHGKGPTPPHG